MEKPVKLVTVVGARPQFIKAAPLSRALRSRARIREVLVHTGQHYDRALSEVFFTELGVPEPERNLGVGSHPPGAQTGRILEAVEKALEELAPDRVLVYGDTNSTLAGALAAAHLGIPVAHVEAGLRSFNRDMPEEINRVLTDHLADLLFCPTRAAVENLASEGITEGVHRVGDVMHDCVLHFREAARRTDILGRLGLDGGGYFLATVHRAENTDDPERLARITSALGELAATEGPVIWPAHPRARKALDRVGISPPEGVRVLAPVSYLEMQALMAAARCVITDSGGVQKEAFFHRVPCVTLRAETEWVETVEHGFNVLAGADSARIVALAREARFPDLDELPDLYGDGRASEAIVDLLEAASGSG